MAEAVYEDEKDKLEIDRQLIAWQTALLMNASGNMKKPVTMERLLGGKAENSDEPKSENGRLDRDEKNRKLDELKKKFKQPS